jgi:hypothetical protein
LFIRCTGGADTTRYIGMKREKALSLSLSGVAHPFQFNNPPSPLLHLSYVRALWTSA